MEIIQVIIKTEGGGRRREREEKVDKEGNISDKDKVNNY